MVRTKRTEVKAGHQHARKALASKKKLEALQHPKARSNLSKEADKPERKKTKYSQHTWALRRIRKEQQKSADCTILSNSGCRRLIVDALQDQGHYDTRIAGDVLDMVHACVDDLSVKFMNCAYKGARGNGNQTLNYENLAQMVRSVTDFCPQLTDVTSRFEETMEKLFAEEKTRPRKPDCRNIHLKERNARRGGKKQSKKIRDRLAEETQRQQAAGVVV